MDDSRLFSSVTLGEAEISEEVLLIRMVGRSFSAIFSRVLLAASRTIRDGGVL